MPYTYIITHIASNVKYYGVRYARSSSPDDLGVRYFSSSKVIKKIIKEEGVNAFRFEVRKIFDTAEAALNWERKFLTKINAAESSMWFNKHNGGLKGSPRKSGFKCTEYTKQKMKKPKSVEHRAKLASHLNAVRIVPQWSEEKRLAQAEKMKGNKFGSGERKSSGWSEERLRNHAERMKGNSLGKIKTKIRSALTCPHCGKEGRANMTRYHFSNCKFRVETP